MTALQERGYTVRSYADADPAARHLILRHDVDMSLAAALAMAETEHRLGVRAIYFVLLRSELYNPLSAQGTAAIRRLIDMGHGLGLHLDASLYADDADQLETAARAEIDALEAVAATPVDAISFHRPAKALLGLARTLAGRPHAYHPRFFSEMGYCSDSRGAWHHGHPLDHPAVQEGRALQLLTHPIWWPPAAAAASPAIKLARFLQDRAALLDEELARQCDVHVGSRNGGS
ncbi:MAG: hypothetical protein AB7G39_01960 [Alphaproteobacteria bacterium]